jgi:hypothetical protein
MNVNCYILLKYHQTPLDHELITFFKHISILIIKQNKNEATRQVQNVKNGLSLAIALSCT